jgi:methyltransferase-like protein
MSLLGSLKLEIGRLNEDYAESSAELAELQLQASIMEKRLTAASKVSTKSNYFVTYTLQVKNSIVSIALRKRTLAYCFAVGATHCKTLTVYLLLICYTFTSLYIL